MDQGVEFGVWIGIAVLPLICANLQLWNHIESSNDSGRTLAFRSAGSCRPPSQRWRVRISQGFVSVVMRRIKGERRVASQSPHGSVTGAVYPGALAHTVQQEERALRSIRVAGMVVFRDVQ